MKSKTSGLATLLVFLFLIFGQSLWGLFAPDAALSAAERRKLAQLPTSSIVDGQWFKDFDKYAADQFPARDGFRTMNALVRTGLFRQQDVGGLYVEDGVVFKSDYPLQPNNIDRFVSKTNQVYADYIAGKATNYFAAVIPDKGYFDTSSRLKTDAQAVAKRLSAGLSNAKYIDLFPALSLESYYKTDTHWSQGMLFPVMEILASAMGFAPPREMDYTKNTLAPFYGVYHGQSALNLPPDQLIYLTSKWTETASVKNTDKPAVTVVYDLDAFGDIDPYDVFLSGGTPLTTITSPNSRTEKELVIFRDSFGSSIAPLFLEEYRTVTLIDLRYFAASLLPSYIDFTNKDVLVLYSALILNSNILLK